MGEMRGCLEKIVVAEETVERFLRLLTENDERNLKL
jgi:hypothetical protein